MSARLLGSIGDAIKTASLIRYQKIVRDSFEKASFHHPKTSFVIATHIIK
jgi:hypothetical protein